MSVLYWRGVEIPGFRDGDVAHRIHRPYAIRRLLGARGAVAYRHQHWIHPEERLAVILSLGNPHDHRVWHAQHIPVCPIVLPVHVHPLRGVDQDNVMREQLMVPNTLMCVDAPFPRPQWEYVIDVISQ